MDRKLNLIMGGVQLGPTDPAPSALLAISGQDETRVKSLGKFISSIQNGQKPFNFGPMVFVGDTRVKVHLTRAKNDDRVLCEIISKLDPRHLTYALVVSQWVPLEQVKVFLDLYELQNHYILTVAFGEKLLFESLHLVKYVVKRRGI